METQLKENTLNRQISSGNTNSESAGVKNNEYNKTLPKDSIVKITNPPLKPLFDSNRIKVEREKIKSMEKILEKNKENMFPIKIKQKMKSSINDNLPPIFTEAHKQVKNDLQSYNKIENDSSSVIQLKNTKKVNSVKRLSKKKVITKITNIQSNDEPSKDLLTDNKLEKRIETIYTPTKDEENIKSRPKINSKKNLNKKESIIAKEKFNNLKNVVTLEDWKKRNRIETDTKVFICSTGYPDMRKALLSRGWEENQDHESLFFDFKCSLSTRNIEHDKLEKYQVVNHFENSGEITRKGRLCVNLRNLKWFRDINIDTFFPRCYDISEINDFDDFIEDFKITKAESILKEYYHDYRNIPEKILLTCIHIFERKLIDIDAELDKSQVIF